MIVFGGNKVNTFGGLSAWGDTISWYENAPGGTYVNIVSTDKAFAALKEDGSITVWGSLDYGGSTTNGSSYTRAPTDTGYVKIFSTNRAFAALKEDGSVKAWGGTSHGGTDPGITSGVVNIFSFKEAFVALKSDGSIRFWGNTNYLAGAPYSVTNANHESFTSPVVNVFSNNAAFAALKEDGSIVVWGYEAYGGSTTDGNGYIGAPSSAVSYTHLTLPTIYAV